MGRGGGEGSEEREREREWEEAAEAVAYDSCTWPPPVVAVCGPGNSGKSAFSRLLLNTLVGRYKKVAYLDTDVGQPEFTPPGFVSIHVLEEQAEDEPEGDPAINLVEIRAAQHSPRHLLIKKEARIIRDLRIIAYFRQCLPMEFPVFSYNDLIQGFASIEPFQLPLSKLQVIDLHSQAAVWPAALPRAPDAGPHHRITTKISHPPLPLLQLSLALVHADVDDGKVLFVPWVERVNS
ncbi:Os01g0354700 [Oryza sativa Japonica Group]|uniref:Os01g0354700 protein n=1 Tax=Oryza sativa subsp. japonica TaxID=39947 RepID=C7IWE0_ORYSJ|nr:Os01g0354700 [Oryza sativa Japonica Group]|eukprot:NP_001172330.1 Os01g0354700 [Oryza sativa Japonica Group]